MYICSTKLIEVVHPFALSLPEDRTIRNLNRKHTHLIAVVRLCVHDNNGGGFILFHASGDCLGLQQSNLQYKFFYSKSSSVPRMCFGIQRLSRSLDFDFNTKSLVGNAISTTFTFIFYSLYFCASYYCFPTKWTATSSSSLRTYSYADLRGQVDKATDIIYLYM